MCSSRKCRYRIHTEDLSFDELACPKHSKDLERHADKVLGSPGKIRNHLTSSSELQRAKR